MRINLKLMTLNLWCYFDWNNREENIHSLINGEAPDIIAFQEAQTNHSFSPNPQSDTIADVCGYKYRTFAPTYGRDGQIDKHGEMNQRSSYGLALISKHPIVASETYFLRQHPDHDEACSVLFSKIEIEGRVINLCNVHFGNSDLFSDLHLNELIDLCEKRNVKPIILGDFNIFDLSAYSKTRLKNYTISTDITNYESMPKNGGTLDYIAAPKEYQITNVVCPDTYVSDHRALVANVTSN